MKKFLLLRSNKQSGPYSAEDLQQMGLKPYDLIWVDGKSAAWRYPGEVEELKAFAPAVEEQPYDRFYKKHVEAETVVPVEAAVTQPAVQEPPVQQPPVQQLAEKPARKEKEYKRVFVTLPKNGQYQPPAQPAAEPFIPQVKPEPKQNTFQHIPADNTDEKELYERKVAAATAAKSGYSKQVASKEPDSETYYPKKRLRIKGVPLVAMIIGMLVMTGLGIVIGMKLSSNKGFSLIKKVDKVTPPDNTPRVPVDVQPGGGNEALNQTAAQLIQDSIDQQKNEKQALKTVPAKKKNVTTDTNQQNVAINLPPKEEPQTTKEEIPVKKEVPKLAPDFEKLVSVSNNNFEVGPFGGISKLALTVNNSSDYELNLVVVQLEYLKANKEVFKTENIYFRDVAANSTLTVDAPRSGRGNKINYKITLINSKDHIYHAGN